MFRFGNKPIEEGQPIFLMWGLVKPKPWTRKQERLYHWRHAVAWMGNFVQDGIFWQFLAYCAGTGGSALIIGSAAGVAVMGLEKIDFVWYLKRMSLLAIAGYLAGAAVYWLIFGLAA